MPRTIHIWVGDEFKESEHPRAENGEFGSGGSKGASSIHSLIKEKTSAAHGGSVPQKGELRKIYHTTTPEAAVKILQSGFKSSAAIDPAFAKEVYGGNEEKDGGEFAYFGTSKEASQNNAIGNGVTFLLNGEPFSADMVMQKEQEGGIAMTKKTIPPSAITGIIMDKTDPANKAVAAAWEAYKRKVANA